MPPRTHKTPQLMKLLTGGASVSNPILDKSFKDEIIRSQANPVPVKPMPAKEGSGTEINITSELITQWLPKVMERFNMCLCDRCRAETAVECFDSIRPIIVKVRSDSDLKRAQRLKADRERGVLMQIIRIAIKRKAAPRHRQG